MQLLAVEPDQRLARCCPHSQACACREEMSLYPLSEPYPSSLSPSRTLHRNRKPASDRTNPLICHELEAHVTDLRRQRSAEEPSMS